MMKLIFIILLIQYGTVIITLATGTFSSKKNLGKACIPFGWLLDILDGAVKNFRKLK